MSNRLEHDGPCYYCNEPTESHAGNPGLWPVMLCHPDDPGRVKHHHARCVGDRLAEVKQLKAELDTAWRAALEQGDETTRLQSIIRRHAAAMVNETDKAVQP